MKMTLMLLGLSLASQLAVAESKIICEDDRVDRNNSVEHAGLPKAIDRLNLAIKRLGDQASQVSAPSIALDGNGFTACVTITR